MGNTGNSYVEHNDSRFEVGDVVWVDEGDGRGCIEYRGIVERIAKNGTLSIRVTSHRIGHGAATSSLRKADPKTAERYGQ